MLLAKTVLNSLIFALIFTFASLSFAEFSDDYGSFQSGGSDSYPWKFTPGDSSTYPDFKQDPTNPNIRWAEGQGQYAGQMYPQEYGGDSTDLKEKCP